MNKIPVFDIGDTLSPSNSNAQEIIKDVIGEAPEIDLNEYCPYVPEEMQEWLDDNEIEGNGEDITKAYLDDKKDYLKEEVFPMLRRIADDFGPIGLISDNRMEAKEFYTEQFKEAGVDLEGFVVSEEVGVKKPGREIFEALLEQREEDSERFVYFGNYVDRDKGAEKVGMHFVWVKEFCTYGSSTDGTQIEELTYENVERALKEVEKS